MISELTEVNPVSLSVTLFSKVLTAELEALSATLVSRAVISEFIVLILPSVLVTRLVNEFKALVEALVPTVVVKLVTALFKVVRESLSASTLFSKALTAELEAFVPSIVVTSDCNVVMSLCTVDIDPSVAVTLVLNDDTAPVFAETSLTVLL